MLKSAKGKFIDPKKTGLQARLFCNKFIESYDSLLGVVAFFERRLCGCFLLLFLF